MEEKRFKIKVCGMKYPANIQEVTKLSIDYMGFIFYPKSPRYISQETFQAWDLIPSSIQKVGVFVNENIENILTNIHKFKLDIVQLHGIENRKLCLKIRKEANVKVIKAFSIANKDNFKVTQKYEDAADLFLFDTKTDLYGGSGQKFNWQILNEYKGEKEFFLSGGIGIDDAEEIRKLNLPKLFGVDLNSRFELEYGLKNTTALQQFITTLQQPKTIEKEQ
jgi:phosphoribosylanthranilate isomerase